MCIYVYIYVYICVYIFVCVLSRNFSDWFIVGEGDKLLVSTLLPRPIVRTTPSVLLV